MKTKLKTNWWIDLVLFTGFITTFFLNLTGVELHQWIGVLSSALAAFHLLVHLNWIEAVSKRFFTKTSAQARVYYVVDVLLLLGFMLIGVTGLVISTWLNFSLSNYTLWLETHITISITTLMVLLLKLILHSRWIVSSTRKILARPVKMPTQNVAMQPAKVGSNHMGRGEFLRVMGIVGAASFLALVNASKSLADSAATQTTSDTEETTTTALQSSSLSSSSNCTVSCQKGCSYPGHCHRYTDTNNNGRCDLGECI